MNFSLESVVDAAARLKAERTPVPKQMPDRWWERLAAPEERAPIELPEMDEDAKSILFAKFVTGLTDAELGRKLGCSRQYASFLVQWALEELKWKLGMS